MFQIWQKLRYNLIVIYISYRLPSARFQATINMKDDYDAIPITKFVLKAQEVGSSSPALIVTTSDNPYTWDNLESRFVWQTVCLFVRLFAVKFIYQIHTFMEHTPKYRTAQYYANSNIARFFLPQLARNWQFFTFAWFTSSSTPPQPIFLFAEPTPSRWYIRTWSKRASEVTRAAKWTSETTTPSLAPRSVPRVAPLLIHVYCFIFALST